MEKVLGRRTPVEEVLGKRSGKEEDATVPKEKNDHKNETGI